MDGTPISLLPETPSLKLNDRIEISKYTGIDPVTGDELFESRSVKAPIIIDIECTTEDDATPTPLLAGGIDALTLDDETVWKVEGDGEVVDEDGNVGYFKFDAMMRNINGGVDQDLNLVKVVTGGASPSASASGSTSSNATSTANEECLAIGKAFPDGTINVSCGIGYGLATATFGVTSSGANLVPYALGDAGVTLKWKARLSITIIKM